MDLIIFAHPDNERSHNAAILKHVTQRLKGRFVEFQVIDLYADGFDPVLRVTKESDRKNMLIDKYRKLIVNAERLIFIFPVWWYAPPAMLKGFVDIIFSPGFAHDFDPNNGGLKQMLKGKKAVIINTYGRSEAECESYKRAPEITLDKAVLQFCGVEVVSRIDWYDVRPPSVIPPKIANQIDEALK